MIGVSRDNEHIVITIRILAWASLGAGTGAAIGFLANWILWPAASASAGFEAIWFFRLGAVVAILLGSVAGGGIGMILGLLDTRALRLAAALSALLGSLVTLVFFRVLIAHAETARVDGALLCFRYLLVGSVSGLVAGVVLHAVWRRYISAAPPGPRQAKLLWRLVEPPSNTIVSEGPSPLGPQPTSKPFPLVQMKGESK